MREAHAHQARHVVAVQVVVLDGVHLGRGEAVQAGSGGEGGRNAAAHVVNIARPQPGVQLTAGGNTCCLASTTFLRLQLPLVELLCPCFLAGSVSAWQPA